MVRNWRKCNVISSSHHDEEIATMGNGATGSRPGVRIGLIFTGQGFQRVGMYRDLYEDYPEFRETFEEANGVLNYKLQNICFKQTFMTRIETKLEHISERAGHFFEEMIKVPKIHQTIFTQPIICAGDIGCFRVLLREIPGLDYHVIAGHSLGEYPAFIASGAVSFQDGMKVVKKRGEYMHDVSKAIESGLLAVVNKQGTIPKRYIERLCRKHYVNLALHNSDSAYIVGGLNYNLRKMAVEVRRKKRFTAIPVQVSGAFHTYLMQPAGERLRKTLERIPFKRARPPILANTTSKPISNPTHVRDEAYRQLTQTVIWRDILWKMHELGINLIIELGMGSTQRGNGSALSKYTRQTYPADQLPEILTVEDKPSLDHTKKRLRELGF
jgi:[acyl-carrier-protein] S-malonyltransferase